MCTVILLHQVHAEARVIIANNRDEFRARPTDDVHVWTPEGTDRPVVAGRDQLSGGTWFAVGPRVVAAVTNHRAGEGSPPGKRSRGELVARAATSEDVASFEGWAEGLEATDFGPFHLLVADGDDVSYLSNADGRWTRVRVAPGVHVLRNAWLDDEDDPVGIDLRRRVKGQLARPLAELDPWLRAELARPAPAGPCIDRGIYGTRSSGVLAWGGPGPARLATTGGPPDVSPWTDRAALLEQVRPTGG